MKRTAVFAVGCLLLGFSTVAAAETLSLNSAFTGPVRQIFEKVMKEVFERHGMEVKVSAPSAERALQHANLGIDDGDGPRIAGLSKTYPNLIQVPEKIIDVQFVAFSKQGDISIDGWDSLKPYRVGILIGWKILENNIVGTQSLRKVDHISTLFRMLETGRIDIAVINKVDGQTYIRENNISSVKALSPPLAEREMFLYLHKKHESLVPKIAATLKEMKSDRTYQKIVGSVMPE